MAWKVESTFSYQSNGFIYFAILSNSIYLAPVYQVSPFVSFDKLAIYA